MSATNSVFSNMIFLKKKDDVIAQAGNLLGHKKTELQAQLKQGRVAPVLETKTPGKFKKSVYLNSQKKNANLATAKQMLNQSLAVASTTSQNLAQTSSKPNLINNPQTLSINNKNF